MARPERRGAPEAEARGRPALAAILSAILPGTGQFLLGRRERGLTLLAGMAGIAVVIAWYGGGAWWAALAPYWLAQVVDAYRLAGGLRAPVARLALLGMLPVYLVGWQAMEIAPYRLVERYDKVQPLIKGLTSPQVFDRSRETVAARVRTHTPCGEDEQIAPAPLDASEPSVSLDPGCAPLEATVTVRGTGFPADDEITLEWIGPTGDRIGLGNATTDGSGAFERAIEVPAESIPARIRERNPDLPQRQQLEASAVVSTGGLGLHETMRVILANIGVTIALGFLATVLGALLAVPLAMLGARNLMAGHAASRPIYHVARLVMNVMRSIEPLIIAVVFVVWVGQGPFAGMLALTVHTVAALGKLFSEAIESIDPGPVEAIRASGATWLQQVAFAVLPQVLPPFTAFTVYRWDINVRMSTIIGFVGGGGIGFLLQQWIFKTKWSETATAVLVIAIVLIVLDQLSSSVRERITRGQPVLPRLPALRALVGLLVLAFTAWAWRTTTVDLVRLARDFHKVVPIVSQLARPALLDRETTTDALDLGFAAPCGDVRPGTMERTDRGSGMSFAMSPDCAEAGENIVVRGEGIPPDASLRLRWLLPGERRLDAGRAELELDGSFESVVEVRPIIATESQAEGRDSVQLQLEVSRPVGRLQPSEPLRITLSRLVETILMALMAATIGALASLPLAFLGARNIMPYSLAGNAIYYASRTFMNVVRAIEPLILAAVFTAWVGYGSPFPGIVALVVVTMANLGKLFSEAVENIDTGPLEALQASGASRMQVVRFGVVPQVVPPFLAFGIYFWDIDTRLSTILGFVGAGGIGFVLSEWMRLTRWNWAAVAILAIVIVVTAMDTLSARVRERLV